MDLGDFNLGQPIDFNFTTRARSAQPTTFLGSPALRVYKANNTIESASGITLTVDYDGITGLNHVHIDTSVDTAFYTSRTEYDVVVTSGTVDSISVAGEVLAHFNILDWSLIVNPTPTTPVDTPTVSETVAIWQERILLEVGADVDGADDLDPITWQINSIWNDWAGKGLVGPYLQYLYTKRQCLQILAGQIRSNAVGSTLGPITTKGQDKFHNLLDLINQCTDQIKEEEKRQAVSRIGYGATSSGFGPIIENGQLPVVPWFRPAVQEQSVGNPLPGSKFWRF